MALTGHLSDLSLSELIEFFCNQRKSGRLKVLYPQGAGYFYLQSGSVVDARIGVLHGIDAVYYALTLPNAEFEFSADSHSEKRTINQPWTQVVLEGLRRLDENISPGLAFPQDYTPDPDELQHTNTTEETSSEVEKSFAPAFLAMGKDSISRRKPVFIGAAVVAVLASVAVIGVPAGWYSTKKTEAVAATETVTQPAPAQPAQTETPAQPQPSAEAAPANEDPAALAARRQREKERRAREAKATETATAVAPAPEAPKSNAKRVVVTVTYDETGRVTQASGGDANALRIARQKRFPAGKAGSATISIPIN
jgi:Tfp pilus assembly protein PilE